MFISFPHLTLTCCKPVQPKCQVSGASEKLEPAEEPPALPAASWASLGRSFLAGSALSRTRGDRKRCLFRAHYSPRVQVLLLIPCKEISQISIIPLVSPRVKTCSRTNSVPCNSLSSINTITDHINIFGLSFFKTMI